MSAQLQVTGEAKIRDLQGPVVANSGVITALDGLPSQYVRGDGTLADIPSVTGGGASVSYYLNGSVNQGTFGGSTYYQLGESAITGVGTNFSTSTNGLLAQFITDANVPDQTEIPSGNWNIEFYMGVSASSGALASFYVEIYKYDGTTFTLVGSNVTTPEFLTNTTTVDAYFTSVAMPLTAMAETDRIAIRVYANVASKTVTMYTEDNRLCQIVTTFSRGMLSLNSLTDQQQYITVGTAGTDFNIVSSVDTHTFNIPIASATNTGKLSSSDWSVFNAKQPALTFNAPLDNTSNTISIPAASSTVDGYLDNADWTKFNTAYNDSIVSAAVTGTTTKTLTLTQQDAGTITASWTDYDTAPVTSVFGRTGAVVATSGDYNTSQVTELTNLYYTDARSRAAISLTTTGTSGAATYNNLTGVLNIPQYQGGVTSFNTRTGAVTLTSGDVTGALGFTPYNATNPSNYISLTSLSAGTGISYNNTTGVISSTITQYTDALARAAISLTTAGTSGSSVYNSTTGVLNVPSYTLAGLGGIGAGFVTSGTLFARAGFTTYRNHNILAADDATIKSLSGTEDNWIYLDAANAQWGIYHRNIDTDLVVSGQPTLPANSIAFIGANEIASYVNLANGNGFFKGTISASNFSGSSSGTNTGDQDLSGYLTTATAASTYLPLVGGTLTGRLTINVTNNYGVLMNRPAVTNYIGLLYSTANTSQWFVGMRENSTNNYIVYNEVLGTDAFTISRTNNSAIFSGSYGSSYGALVSGTTYGILGVNRNATSAAAGVNYYSTLNQKWFTGIYENTDNFGIYSVFTNTLPLTITPNGLVTFTRNESSYGMVRLKGSAVEASIGYGFATDTDTTTWVVGKGAGLGDTTFGWYYGGVKMILTTGGNLLVNTPTGVTGGGALQVNGNVNINGVFQINGVTIGGGGGSGVTGSGTTNYITKWSGSSTLSNSVMYDNGTNVGISATTVPEKLTVGGNILSYASSSAWAEGLSVIVPTVATWGGVRLRRERANYDGNWGFGYVGFDSSDDLVFISNNGGTQINNILRLTKPGSVLINTGTDLGSGYKLQVNGSISMSYASFFNFRGSSGAGDVLVDNSGSTLRITGNVSVAGSVTATGGFFDTSDSRLKTLVTNNHKAEGIENVTAKLYLKNGKEELGYYAQDLQEILPSAVSEGSDGFLTLSYSQVHTAKIAYLEEKVAQLEELIKKLL